MDLTPSRRSKRLLRNGYYQAPAGETLQTDSSEGDDDSASVHSNTSSIYSERAIHYNESPSTHRRRRRRGVDSPHTSASVSHTVSQSPIKTSSPRHKIARQPKRSVLVSKNVSQNQSTISRQEVPGTSKSLVKRESKTTITSTTRSMNQHFARGESSLVTASMQRTQLEVGGIGDHSLPAFLSNQRGLMTRQMTQAQVVDENHLPLSGAVLAGNMSQSAEHATSQHVYENSNEEFETLHDVAGSTKVQYSSAESDMGESEFGCKMGSKEEYQPEAIVSVFVSRVSDVVLSITTFLVTFFAAICQSVYQATLAVNVFDVWWLSQRTSPLFAKVIRTLLLLLLLLLLLYGTNYAVNQLHGEETSALLLPVQSIGGAFHMLSQKIRAFSAPVPTEEDILLQAESIAKIDKSQALYPATYPELVEALSRMELQFADKLVEVKKVIERVRKQQFDYNKRQMEDFRGALADLEHKLRKEILKQISLSDDQTTEKLQTIKAELISIRTNRSKSGDEVKADIEKLRVLLSDRSQVTTKMSEYNTKLAAFDARLTTLNNLMIKSMKDFDRHAGNTTYLKEIAKMQFIESFLHLMKTIPNKEPLEGQNNLNFLFIAWLKRQGFANVEEIERSVAEMAGKTNDSLAALDLKFTQHLEKVRQTAQRHASSITMERLMERPLKSNVLGDSDMENQVKQWIYSELETYSADRIALADHALESAGGFIVSTRCSESYNRKTALISVLGIPIYYNINTPRSVIQASTLPGECWSFKGSEGYVVISLSGAVLPTSFTLEHIPKELSPHGRIDSAPKDFTVLGLHDSYDYDGIPLGDFRYEEDGPVIQQFAALAQPDHFTHIELRVKSNWGHKEYTCLYRFRVHGTRQEGVPLV